MEFSLLWTLASIVVFNVWKAHGSLPIPVLHFENIIIEDDDTTITCTLPHEDCQDAELVIKMDNVSLTNCDHKKGSYPNVSCTIEVTQNMHEMEVTCEAQFKSLSKPEKMMLQTIPKFTDCPEKLVWIEGQGTSFHCKATGYPLPNVTCETKGRIYKDGETFTAVKSMSGNYTCKAKNTDSIAKIVTVSVEYKPKIVNINVRPPLRDKGDEVMLNCEAKGLPDPTYSWKVPSSDVMFSSDNRTITVQSLQNSQLGKYTCAVQNQHGTDAMEHVLDLAVKPKILNITAQPSMQVLEGENVTLTCDASGFPNPVYTWEAPKANMQFSQDRRTIWIWGLKKNHVGEYHCKAKNTYGEDTRVQKLTIAVKPKVVQIKVQPSTSVEEGTNVTLTCVTEGDPPPRISWMQPTSGVQYSSDKRVIHIWGANKTHDGNYQCTAENNHGVDIRTTKISVKASLGSRGERRESEFATFLATLIATILLYYLC